jgi:hypothetical protein
MPRIISPIRKRPLALGRMPERHDIPIHIHDSQNITQTRVFNYKLFFTSLIVLGIIGCSILFCGIQDTLRYLKNIVLLGILLYYIGINN